MSPKHQHLKILLLQIREDALTSEEERQEFLRFGRLQPEQMTCLNAFAEPAFSPDLVEGYDALFVGGSSDASVLKPDIYPFVNHSKAMLQCAYDHDIPVFASCFGFQLAVEQFGGKVILDKANMEMGIHTVQRLPIAEKDILFHDVSDQFWVVSGHKERAETMPEGAIVLAATQKCPFHAFKMQGKRFYGFQFHPEVDKQDLITRITRYQNRYLEDDAALTSVIAGALHETTEASDLVYKFIERVVCATPINAA